MKKISITAIAFLLLLFLTGCLTTLHPIFTEKELVYESRLVGNWDKNTNDKKEGRALITNLATEHSIELPGNVSSIKQKGYLVSYLDKNGHVTDRYIAFLARIGKHLYFDYYPTEDGLGKKIDDFYSQHLVKMHTSYRVDILPNGSFQLNQLDEGYLNSLINDNKIRIRHELNSDGDIVITAPTAELQQYLIKYGDDPGAYMNEKTIFSK